jgi:hypothetical protein
MIIYIAHNIFRHTDKTVTRINAAVRSHCKCISHAIDKGADISLAGEHAPAQVVDIHNVHVMQMLKGFVEEIHQKFSIFFWFKCPSLGIFGT